ncbi:MAG TPA: hypothetical protein VH082_08945 [Rudaea sp.]|nr:hypothetical protein [Rudaea sp.]
MRLLRKIAAMALCGFCASTSALTVTQPGSGTVVPAGDEYATEQLSDPWDMNDAADMDTEEPSAVINQVFSNGIFSGDTSAAGGGNRTFPLFGGYISSINSSRGFNHPVDTQRYRYFTVKMRATRPTSNVELANLYFYSADVSGACGLTSFHPLPASTWTIFTFDMVTDAGVNSDCPHHWTDFPVGALLFDPALDSNVPFASVHFDIDWIRLTGTALPSDDTSVQWSDTGYSGTYSVTLNETGSNPVSVLLASGVSGTSYLADLTRFPAAQYTITVSRDTGTATSATSGNFRINLAPMVSVAAPDKHGDQAKNFAATVVGNAWGPINATDFAINPTGTNWASANYNMPTGSFYGRPKNNDPEWYMNLGSHAIDTSLYRSLCFTLKDFGQRAVGQGSVARFFWGQKTNGQLTVSQDVPLDAGGPNEYCFADVAAVPVESVSLAGPWTGTQTLFRLDPHEFPVSTACMNTKTPADCHDVQLDSVVLSPFYDADPGFTFKWNLVDDDADVEISLYLDRDTTPDNGNEFPIYSASVPSSNGQFVWQGSADVSYGTYQVYIVADDGKNSVTQYATGPLIVGARDGIFRNGFQTVQ